MKKLKLTVFIQIAYGLGGLTSFYLGYELYNIVINHIIFTIGYFVGLYGLSIFYNGCCVTHNSKEETDIDIAQDFVMRFNQLAEQLKPMDPELLESMNRLNKLEKYKKPSKKRF